MSLAKIPFVVLFSLAFNKCITSPNPAPPKTEWIVENTSYTSWYYQVPKYATALQLLAGLAEIILIIAINNPDYKYSALIIRALLFKNNNAANLRLTPATFVGAIMTIFGTLIRISTYHHLGKHFRFKASIQKDHELITGGPYSIVRHPSYTAILFTHSGWLLWQFGSGSWVRESGLLSTLAGKIVVTVFGVLVILVSSIMTFGRMTTEDKALQARFGVEWDQWATRVRYQIIPGVY